MLINLTHYVLNVRKADGSMLVLPPSGDVAEVDRIPHAVDVVDGIAVYQGSHLALVGLPEAQPGVWYVASGGAARVAASQGRLDVLFPGPVLADESGKAVAFLGLSRPEGPNEKTEGETNG